MIATADEAEAADFVVCARADVETPFTDNLRGECCACGAQVVFRPHAPTTPARICLPCLLERMEITIQ